MKATKLNVTMSRTPTYISWCNMKTRCLNRNHVSFHDYGGRGIVICERWLRSFTNFLADMGEKPSKAHFLDRVDNDGNYEPSNCRWATNIMQARNRRSSRKITFNGETKCLAEWAEITEMPYHIIRDRLDDGWSVADALNTKPRDKGRKLKAVHVPIIRVMAEDGLQQKLIAEMFGVCRSLVSNIVSGHTWRHIPTYGWYYKPKVLAS